MKKIIILILLLTLFLNIKEKEIKEEVRGVFISYIEINNYLKKDNQEESKENIKRMIKNIKDEKLNTIILQVRANQDSIYNSKLFPKSLNLVNNEYEEYYDVLEYFINESHKNNIKLIAWINPYRVRTTENINTITNKNPVYKYLNTDIIYIKNGIYLNPSKKEAQELIIKGVKEVLEYDIDGLLFDDYFYPDNEIDIKDYEEYIKNNEEITEQEYRLKIVNDLIEKVHNECKYKNIKFGISPDGNIENNYNKNYADVKLWLSSNKYIDFIMPQIYYGFYNSTKAYINTTKEWEKLIENENIDLYVALAFYKVGQIDKYAKQGFDEWQKNDDIIMREVILSRNLKNYKGFSLFRYENIFNNNIYTDNSLKELNNLKKILK